MRSNLKIYDTPERTAEALATELVAFIQGEIKEGSGVNVALSGGNTPRLLFEVLAERHKTDVDWNYVHFYWADERCVPPSESRSNYGMAWKYLFEHININGSNIHRIRGEEDPEWEAERYSFMVFNSLPVSNTFPVFDIVLLGLGEDGHTASIFPDQMLLLDTEKIYALSRNPESGEQRITMTGRLLNNARNIYFLVCGREKSHIVSEIVSSGASPVYPASFIKPVEGTIQWYLDKDAASLVRS